MPLVFKWNPRKADLNLKKHVLSFAEAAVVFGDPLARIFTDEAHSASEPREIIIGHLSSRKLALVCFARQRKKQSGSSVLGLLQGKSSAIMKNTSHPKIRAKSSAELRPEYRFDYATSKPNRFATGSQGETVAVLLDPDVARVFKNAHSVNAVLRALLTTMPGRRKPVPRLTEDR